LPSCSSGVFAQLPHWQGIIKQRVWDEAFDDVVSSLESGFTGISREIDYEGSVMGILE